MKISCLQDFDKLILNHIITEETVPQLISFSNIIKDLNNATIVYNSLNQQQQDIFLNVLKFINSDEYFYLIDAPPGTGKTFLTVAIIFSCSLPSMYLAYSNELINQLQPAHFVFKNTICKNFMQKLNISFETWKHLIGKNFDDNKSTIETIISRSAKDCVKIYFVDEYTVLNPWTFYILSLYAKKNDSKIIFTGDRYQLGAIRKTRFHNALNYALLSYIIKEHNVSSLTANIRQQNDITFCEKLNDLKNYVVNNHNVDKEIPINFDVKFKLYCLFKTKFHANPDYKNIYMASFYKTIKNRLSKLKPWCEKNGIEYQTAKVLNANTRKFIEPVNSNKFESELTLIVGFKYYWIHSKSIKYIVTLRAIDEHELLIEIDKDLSIKNIIRTDIRNFMHPEILPIIYAQNDEPFSRKDPVFLQFPLKNLYFSYHSVQGLTLSNIGLDMNIDASSFNAIYVGLSRLNNESQLNLLESLDVLNLAVTYLKNDTFYYKIDPNNYSQYKTVCFKEITNREFFNSRCGNFKILKQIYLEKKIIDETQLDKFTEQQKLKKLCLSVFE